MVSEPVPSGRLLYPWMLDTGGGPPAAESDDQHTGVSLWGEALHNEVVIVEHVTRLTEERPSMTVFIFTVAADSKPYCQLASYARMAVVVRPESK